MKPRSASLSKTRFQSGLLCHRRLWLESYRRELADPPGVAARLRMAGGHEIGELARGYWPGGELVTVAPARHARAVVVTDQLLKDPAIPAVFEAAFEHDDIRVRADAVVRNGAGFDLVEVKSAGRVRPEHITDVAVQLHVIEAAGLDVKRAFLMHLRREYVWHGGLHDPARLFELTDVTGDARAFADGIDAVLPAMKRAVAADDEPDIAIGRHCRRPYRCPFHSHCWAGAPAHPPSELPRAGEALLAGLAADGVESIDAIVPDTYELTMAQESVRRAVTTGRPQVKRRALSRALAAIAAPVTHLDFETLASPLPLYAGTSPHEVIPFQWSAHIEDAEGGVSHHEFLWTEPGDPRPAFLESLAAVLPASGSIVVYTGYEEQRLRDLARAFPAEAQPVLETFRERVVDLHAIVRDHVYHPRFHGSFSLKRVAPALLGKSPYEDLTLTGGADAAAIYRRMVAKDCPATERDRIDGSLRRYCEADTRVLVELRAALHDLARGGSA